MASAWEPLFGKPAKLIQTSTGASFGTFVVVHADTRRGQPCLWLQSESGGNLRMREDGEVDLNGARGPWATFEVSAGGTPTEFRLFACGKKALLGVNESGKLALADTTSECGTWSMEPSSDGPRKAFWLSALDDPSVRFGPFNAHWLASGKVLLGCGPASGNLRLSDEGILSSGGACGPWAQFQVEHVGDGYRLGSVAGSQSVFYLGVSDNKLVGRAQQQDAIIVFKLLEAEGDGPWARGHTWTAKLSCWEDFQSSAQLSESARRDFIKNGYLHIPKVVPRELVDAALREINAALCSRGGVTVEEDGKIAFCPKIASSDAMLNLLYASPAWTMAQLLVGRDRLHRPQGGQIALRPPELGLVNRQVDQHLSKTSWHIDGMEKGLHSPFTVLLGITLSSASAPNCGNLCVWPGSHHVTHPLIRDQVRAGAARIFHSGAPALDNGVQVLAEPGDIVFAHHKLAHRGGPNTSTDIRYQVYFRLRHIDHQNFVESGQVLDDLWLEFEGLQHLLPAGV